MELYALELNQSLAQHGSFVFIPRPIILSVPMLKTNSVCNNKWRMHVGTRLKSIKKEVVSLHHLFPVGAYSDFYRFQAILPVLQFLMPI